MAACRTLNVHSPAHGAGIEFALQLLHVCASSRENKHQNSDVQPAVHEGLMTQKGG